MNGNSQLQSVISFETCLGVLIAGSSIPIPLQSFTGNEWLCYLFKHNSNSIRVIKFQGCTVVPAMYWEIKTILSIEPFFGFDMF